MPVSFEFLRGIVGVIGIGCAFMTGRAFALYRKGIQKQFRFFGWVFRTVLCMVAVGLRHNVDAAAITIWTLAAVAFAVLKRNRKTGATIGHSDSGNYASRVTGDALQTGYPYGNAAGFRL